MCLKALPRLSPWLTQNRAQSCTLIPTLHSSYDSVPLSQMIFAVSNLSLGYYFTGDEGYCSAATNFIDVWFLDEATKMNPKVGLQYSQLLRGIDQGRGIGMSLVWWSTEASLQCHTSAEKHALSNLLTPHPLCRDYRCKRPGLRSRLRGATSGLQCLDRPEAVCP